MQLIKPDRVRLRRWHEYERALLFNVATPGPSHFNKVTSFGRHELCWSVVSCLSKSPCFIESKPSRLKNIMQLDQAHLARRKKKPCSYAKINRKHLDEESSASLTGAILSEQIYLACQRRFELISITLFGQIRQNRSRSPTFICIILLGARQRTSNYIKVN